MKFRTVGVAFFMRTKARILIAQLVVSRESLLCFPYVLFTYLPHSYSAFFFGILNEAIMVYLVTAFFVITDCYFLKLGNWFDLIFLSFLVFSGGCLF